MQLDRTVLEKLSAPFANGEVQYKPGPLTKDKTRALALPYIDARAVMDRLDEIVGPEGWSFRPEAVNGNAVIGHLTVYGLTKSDIGLGEDLKGAASDALKRAAVHFGIGRYLYSLPQEWRAWDAERERFAEERKATRPTNGDGPTTFWATAKALGIPQEKARALLEEKGGPWQEATRALKG